MRASCPPPPPSRSLAKARLFALCLAAAGPALCLPRSAWSIGENTGRIGGFVTIEGTSDGLSDVDLTVTSRALIGGPQTAKSGPDGSFTFRNLPPGAYELTVRMEGFAPIQQRNIQVNAGALTSVDLRLQLQTTPQVNEEIRIIEKVNPTLNPDTAAAVTTLGNAQITKSPSFRQEKGVAQFTAGVTQGSDRASVRGGLGRFNRYFIDGLEVTDITTGAFGTSSALINSDSVEQFIISTGAMDAEYNSMGLVQNMVTRSGGNKFTVDTSFILQPTFVSDTTRYATRVPLYDDRLLYDERPLSERMFYSFALNVGGPIIKDRLWFFTSFQFNFNRLTIPIDAQPRPYPQSAYDRYQDQTLFLARAKLTWQASQSTRVSVAYSLDRNFIWNASTSSAISGVDPNTLAPEAERRVLRGGDWASLLVDSALSPKLYFQLQTGMSNKRALEDAYNTFEGQPDRITPAHTLNTTTAANGFTYLNGNRDWDQQVKWNFQFAPTLLYSTTGLGGKHDIKGGMQVSYMRYEHNVGVPGGMRYVDAFPATADRVQPCDPNVPLSYGSCSQRLVYPESAPSGNTPGAGYDTVSQALNLGFFLQDRYTVGRWLTIVPGLRFDVGTLYDNSGTQVASLFGVGPRLSLVYDLLHDRSTLILAHYGRHNDVGNAFIAERTNPSQTVIDQRWNTAAQRFEDFRRSGGAGAQLFGSDLTPPKMDEVSIGVHREVIEQLVAGVDYTYRHYGNLWVNEEINQIWDPAGTRVVGFVNGERQRIFQATTPDEAERRYHGLDLWVRGTPGRWDVTTSYTLAILRGTVTDYFDGGLGLNPRLSRLFDGDLPGQPRHYLKALVNYNFDFGLTLGTRFQYMSGAYQWKSFRSPEDNTFNLYRSPRGSDTGTRTNDPQTWAEFRLPDQVVLDIQVSYSLQKLTKQRIDLIAMIFNALNIAAPFQIDTRDGATFGTATRRADNIFAEFVIRYRY